MRRTGRAPTLLIGLLLSVLPPPGFAGGRHARAVELPGTGAIRAAVADLEASFPDGYRESAAHLERLAGIERRAQGLGDSAPESDRAALLAELEALRRDVVLSNPLVSGRPLLFVVRSQYRPDHHNTETMFQTGEINTGSFQGGGALAAIDLASGAPARRILDVPNGVARDPDVSFDGSTILFSMRRDRDDDYHIYTVGADGTGLRQLTTGSGLSDIDPTWLPDGRILFTSTREPKYCMCNRHIMGNLFTMRSDGANLQQIGHSTLHEGHPSVLPDGRILYDRWEYVDRNFGDAQGVWTTNPDGTNHALFWKNNTRSPGAVLDARAIPGTGLFIATFSSCHDRPWGAIAIVDRARGLEGRDPVVRTWPASAMDLVGVGDYDTFTRVNPKHEDPWPLSDRHFLCSRMTGHGEEMGIWLLDAFGNEVLVHAEPPGCFDPMPLGPRPRPPAIPPRIDLARAEGTFYVEDVYAGSGMESVPRGSILRIRVVESPEKRYWTHPAWDGGTGQQAPGMGWDDFNNKRVLGTAPVEADGSAYLSVPADTFVYFQLLDEKGMMVQSMRSGTIVRPGEAAGCIGCHEPRHSAVPPRPSGLAWRRAPSPLEPWHGPTRLFGYAAEVQPVLDRHCVSCHDRGKPAGAKLDLSGDHCLIFNRSYIELRRKGLVRVVGAGPAEVQLPGSWGSRASRLARVLLEGHGDPEVDSRVRLDAEGFDRIVTWIDINAPYYPTYASSYPGNLYGRSPLDDGRLRRLSELTGADLFQRDRCADVTFTRPEMSPCLDPIRGDSARLGEALAIIRSGAEALAARPREDMPGHDLSSADDIRREAKYRQRLEEQQTMREAMSRGLARWPAGATAEPR